MSGLPTSSGLRWPMPYKLGPRGWALMVMVFTAGLGAILLLFGVLAGIQGRGASATPVPADLARLEAGEPLPNIHVQLGEHLRLYPFSLYMYETTGGQEVKPTSTIKGTYTPIVSPTNPYARALESLVKKYGSVERIPPQELPRPYGFAVLLSTHRLATVGDIPDRVQRASTVHGLMNNRMVSLGKEEQNLIRQNLPGVDPEKLLIYEEDMQPASPVVVLALILSGVVLIGAGVVLFVVTKGPISIRAAAPAPPAGAPVAQWPSRSP